MTGLAAEDLVERLHAALAAGALSGRAAESARGLLDRLSAPVRIAVLGLPGSGAAGLAEALFALPPLPRGPLPPMELSTVDVSGAASDVVPDEASGDAVDGAEDCAEDCAAQGALALAPYAMPSATRDGGRCQPAGPFSEPADAGRYQGGPDASQGLPGAVHIVTMASGDRHRHTGWPGPACFADALHLSIAAPFARLAGRRLLLLEAPGAEFAPALRWAAARSDLAILVSAARGGPERQAWAAAPDALRDHAILVAQGREALPEPGEWFARAFDLLSDPGALAALEGYLADTIAVAREADALAGLMLLRRHAPAALAEPVPCVASDPSTPAVANDVRQTDGSLGQADKQLTAAPVSSRPDMFDASSSSKDAKGSSSPGGDAKGASFPSGDAKTVPSPPVDADQEFSPYPRSPERTALTAADPATPAARDMLCRAFLRLRCDAGALLAQVPAGPLAPDLAGTVLRAAQETLEVVAEMTAEEELFARTYPALDLALTEAQDMVTLLCLEGGPARAQDACALLAQMREETGAALAA